ncbi:hypothetical protein LVJ94_36630 [Pendulispora rubella]|uniref:Uncharacterized protein n=1 Tax=Pendulispora rubella TaxID=2741070 RepID=A0ABZ2KZM4_9BACT
MSSDDPLFQPVDEAAPESGTVLTEGVEEDDVTAEAEPYCYLEEGNPWRVATSCRAAGLAFVNGVGRGWTKRDLARWLVGAYHAAAYPLPGSERVGFGPTMTEVDAKRIERLLFSVRDHVLKSLDATPDGLVSLSIWAKTAGSVLRSRHGSGEMGYIPVDWPRMRLEDRVMSLFAVDALLRPRDYERRLSICGRCASVSFDDAARERGFCDMHPDRMRYDSGILPKTDAETEESVRMRMAK